MLKTISKQLDTNLIRVSLVTSIIYCLLFNTSVFIHNYLYYKVFSFQAIFEFGKDLISIYIFLFITFFGLTIHRLVFIASTLILFISGAIASYYLFFFRIIPNKEMVKLFFSIHLIEIPELISMRLLIWLIFSLLVALYIIKHFKVENTSLFVNKLVSAICLLFALNCIISPPYDVLKKYFPIQYLHNTYLYFSAKTSIKSTQNKYNTPQALSNRGFNG